MTPSDPPITEDELARRVTRSLLMAAARLAGAFDVPLKDVSRLLQTACFQVLRDRGLTLREIGERLDISPSLAASLSKRLKARFLTEGGALALGRRIEFTLWAEPMSLARLLQTLPDDPDEVRAAVDALLSADRVVSLGDRAGRLAPARGATRLVRDEMRARLDGLDQLLGGVTQAVYARFFRPEQPAFARVLTLRLRPEDQGALAALYDEHIWPTLEALDAAAADRPDAREVEFTVTWAPYRLIEKIGEESDR